MSTFSYARTISDASSLLYYVSKTFPTITSVSNEGGTNVILTFSTTLTSPQQTTLSSLLAAYVDPVTPSDGMNLSIYNASSTALAAGAAYTGTWEDVSRYSSIIVTALSNVASAISGLAVQFGISAAQVDVTRSFSVAAATAGSYTLAVPGRWMRVVYTNGASLQTTFSLQVRWSVTALHTVTNSLDSVDDSTTGQLVRSINLGRLDLGTYTGIKADEDKRMRVRIGTDSTLSEVQAQLPLVQVSFLYSINSETVATTLVGASSATYSSGYALLSTAAAASASAAVSSRRVVSVGVGRPARVVVSCAFGTGVTNSTQICGVGSSTDGLFVGYNGTAFGILLRTASTDTWTPATAFNVDKLNGTGSSGLTLDPTKGNVYKITYDTTGFGTATFSLCSAASTEAVVMHRLTLGNASTSPAMRASLPLLASTANSTNTSAVSMRVASMSAYSSSSSSSRTARLRAADYNRTVSTMTYAPIFTLQNKSTYQSTTNTSTIALKSLSISCSGTKGNLLIALYDTATLTGSNFTDASTTTSPAQIDTDSTTVTGGVCLFSTCINCTGNRTVDLVPFDIQIMAGSSITVAARCSAYGTANEVSASLVWGEFE